MSTSNQSRSVLNNIARQLNNQKNAAAKKKTEQNNALSNAVKQVNNTRSLYYKSDKYAEDVKKAGGNTAFSILQSGNAWNPKANQFTFGKTTSADNTGAGYLSVTKASETAAAKTPEYQAASSALADLGYTPEESRDFLLYNKSDKYNPETKTTLGRDVRDQFVIDTNTRLANENQNKANAYSQQHATGDDSVTITSQEAAANQRAGALAPTKTTTTSAADQRAGALAPKTAGQQKFLDTMAGYNDKIVNYNAESNAVRAASRQRDDDLAANTYENKAKNSDDYAETVEAGKANPNNRVTTVRNGGHGYRVSQTTGQDEQFLSKLTDKQYEIYSYYFQKEQNGELPLGTSKKYLESIANRVNSDIATETAQRWNYPVAREIYGFVSGVDAFNQGLENFGNITNEDYVPRYNAMQMGSQNIAANTDGFAKMLYDASYSIGQMAPSAVIGQAFGGLGGVASKLGDAAFGVAIAGNTYKEMLDSGYDDTTAKWLSVALGSWEAISEAALGSIEGLAQNSITEKVLSDTLKKTTTKLGAVLKGLAHFGIDAGQEGMEEIIQDIGSTIITGAITGQYDWSTAEELFYEGIVGALTGGIMGAKSAFVDTKNTIKQVSANNAIYETLGDNSKLAYYRFNNNTNAINDNGTIKADAIKEWLQINELGTNDGANKKSNAGNEYLNTTQSANGLNYLTNSQAYAAYSSGYNDAVAVNTETKVENTPAPVSTQAAAVAPEVEAISAPVQEAVVATENNAPESTQNAPVSSPVYEARQTNIKDAKTLKTAFSEARIANANQSDTFEVVPKKSWSKWNDSVKQSLEDSARTAKAYGKKIEFVNGTINTNDGEYVAIMSDDGKTAYISLNAIKDGKLLDTRKLTSQLFKTKTGITLQAAESEADNGVHLQQSSKRDGSESAAGTSRKVESSTGRTIKNWKTRDGRLNKKLFDGATETTARELGFKNGTDDKRFKILPETPENIKEFLNSSIAKDLGINEKDIVCIDGDISLVDSNGNAISSRGLFDGKNIFVNVNNKTAPAEQIIIHEHTHKLILEGKLNPNWIVEKIASKYGKDAFEKIASIYQSTFDGLPAGIAIEEIICDANSYLNYFEDENGEFYNKESADLINDFQDKIRAEIRNNLNMSSSLGISKRKLTAVANKVVGPFSNSDLGKSYVVGKLDNIYNKLFGENADYELAYKDALRLADEITNSQFEEFVLDDDELQSSLYNSVLYVNKKHLHKDDRKRGGVIARLFGHHVYIKSYDTTKESLLEVKRGRQAIDDKWMELAEMFPERFDPNTSEGDMLEILADALDNASDVLRHYISIDFSKEEIESINKETADYIISLLEKNKAKTPLSETARDKMPKVKEYEEPTERTTDIDYEDLPFNSRDYVSKQDAEYLSLAENPEQNADKLQAMVEQAAREAGYDSPMLYHGTDSFGFTKVNTEKSDDRSTFFATDNEEVSATYTKGKQKREISNDKQKALANANSEIEHQVKRLVNALSKVSSAEISESEIIYDLDNMGGSRFAEYEYLGGLITEALDEDGHTEAYLFDFEDESNDIYGAKRRLIELNKYKKKLLNDEISNSGIYSLYANTDNMFEIDCKNRNWNDLAYDSMESVFNKNARLNQSKDSFIKYFNYYYPAAWTGTNTRGVSKWAKQNGYDGVIFKNLTDNGGKGTYHGMSDVYAFFNPESQVKSADPVTYDDNGNVIPLSERFNSKNGDIRFSRTIERGENPVREIDIPAENIKGEKNGRFVRTVAESESATDSQAERIKQLATYDSLFAYTPITNTKTANNANTRFNDTYGGDLDAAVKGFSDIVLSKRRITAEDIAFGALLIDKLSKIGDTKNYYNVVADMEMLLTESGQVVQAAKILKRVTEYSKQFDESSMAGNIAFRLRGIETAVNKLNKWLDKTFKIGKNKGVQVSISEELKQGLLSAETQEDADYYVDLILKDIADQMPSRFIDKWNAWRYLSMLANPRTHIRNIVGNAIFVPAVMVRNTISGSIQKLNKNASSDRGISQVASKEYRDYAKLVAAEMQGAILGENNKYDERNIILRNKSLFGKSKFGQALNKLSNFNSSMLAKEDLVFKNVYFKSALASYLQANKVDLNNVSEDVLQRGIDIAIKDAYKNTYNDVSRVASALSRSKNYKVAGPIVEAVMPFKQVPINILKRGVEYSPLGFVNAISKGIKSYYVDGQFDFNGFADNLASAITGTGFMLLGYLLKNLGIIQGGEPDDDEELEALGYQPYSITIDGVNVTLDWAAPMSMPFFVGATLSELIEEDGLNSNNVTEALTRLPEPMLEMSFLSGLSDLINSVKYADQNFGNANNRSDGGEVSVAVMSQLLYNYLSQGVPTILGQVARTADPVVRRSLIDKTDDSMPDGVKYFIQKLMGKVPLLESTKEPMLTTWGEEKTNDNFLLRAFENFLSPGYISEINNDKVVQSIAKTDRKIRETDSEHDSNIPQSRYSISLTIYSYDKESDKYKASNEKKVLTPSEITQYEKSVGNKSYNALNGIMKNSGYDSLSYDMKNRVTEKIFSYVNASVATKEFGTNQLAGDGTVEKGFYKYADSNAYAQFIYEAATISQTNKEETISYNQDVVDAALKKLVSKNIITTSQAREIHASKWSSTKNNPF